MHAEMSEIVVISGFVILLAFEAMEEYFFVVFKLIPENLFLDSSKAKPNGFVVLLK